MNTNTLFATEDMFGLKLNESQIVKIYDNFGDEFIPFSDSPLEFEKFEKLATLVNNNSSAYCAALNIIKAYDILARQITLLNESYFYWKNYFGWNFSYKSLEPFDINELGLGGLVELLKNLIETSTSSTITGKSLFGAVYGLKRLANKYIPLELYSSLTAIIKNILVLQEEYKK